MKVSAGSEKASTHALASTLAATVAIMALCMPIAKTHASDQRAPSASAAVSTPPAGSAVVAEVGAKRIVASDLREALVAARKRALSEKRFEALQADAARTTLQSLIDVKVFALAARDQGLDRRPDVARKIENLVDEALAQVEMADALARQPITDEALHRYYNEHLDQFQGAPRVRARHIVVRTREEAAAIREDLQKGADFATIARERNIDSTKTNGGDLGWVQRGVMVKPFDQAVFALKPGEISAVVETPFGFHLVRAEEVEPGKVTAYAAAASEVRKRLIEARVAQMKDELAHRYSVRVHEDVLGAVVR